MEKQPAQHQKRQPGIEAIMTPQPEYLSSSYKGSEKLQGKIALITGGDSGIGRAVACAFAMEGADLVVHYLNEHQDAEKTKELIEHTGQSCLLLAANLQNYTACDEVVRQTMERYGRLDILVNNVAEQHPQDTMEDISCEQMEKRLKLISSLIFI